MAYVASRICCYCTSARSAPHQQVSELYVAVGGEKSYTTVAFALALGEWTQSPFRAMDEFDVFMDAINRRVAMENLFSNSLEQPHLQFIFLTPQAGYFSSLMPPKSGCQWTSMHTSQNTQITRKFGMFLLTSDSRLVLAKLFAWTASQGFSMVTEELK